jgi:hypothetical protein
MRKADLSGVTIVGAGSFNPAIVHPQWLAAKQLIPQELAEHALQPGGERPMIVSPQVSAFFADWLSVQVTDQQAIFSTVDQARESDLRDLVRSFFELLPETPVDGIGINADVHFRTEDPRAWHAFGDRFLPKDFWEPIFAGDKWKDRGDGKHVGMRVMTVEVARNDPEAPGHVRVELAPSVRIIPNGVYVGINAHFQLKHGEERGNGAAAASILKLYGDSTRALEKSLLQTLLNAI